MRRAVPAYFSFSSSSRSSGGGEGREGHAADGTSAGRRRVLRFAEDE